MDLKGMKNLKPIHDPECTDILCCLLGLTSLEAAILWKLQERAATIEELGKKTKRSRSSIQRAVGNLLAGDLAHRKPLPTTHGRKYRYHAAPKTHIKKRLLTELDTNYHEIRKAIKKQI